MIKVKSDILASLKAVLGDNTSEQALSLLEDITDTLDDFETKTKDSTDWKTKFEENDKQWAKKYRDRFFEATDNDKSTPKEETESDENKELSYENLFTEEDK